MACSPGCHLCGGKLYARAKAALYENLRTVGCRRASHVMVSDVLDGLSQVQNIARQDPLFSSSRYSFINLEQGNMILIFRCWAALAVRVRNLNLRANSLAVMLVRYWWKCRPIMKEIRLHSEYGKSITHLPLVNDVGRRKCEGGRKSTRSGSCYKRNVRANGMQSMDKWIHGSFVLSRVSYSSSGATLSSMSDATPGKDLSAPINPSSAPCKGFGGLTIAATTSGRWCCASCG